MEQVLVLTFHVQLLSLMLSQSVECLILRTVEERPPCPAIALTVGECTYSYFLLWYLEWLEGLSALRNFLQDHISVFVFENNSSGIHIDYYADVFRRNSYLITVLTHFWRFLLAFEGFRYNY